EQRRQRRRGPGHTAVHQRRTRPLRGLRYEAASEGPTDTRRNGTRHPRLAPGRGPLARLAPAAHFEGEGLVRVPKFIPAGCWIWPTLGPFCGMMGHGAVVDRGWTLGGDRAA